MGYAALPPIRASIQAGFECIKLNCVLLRGVNERELWPLVLFAAEHNLPLCLIELMPVTAAEVLTKSSFMGVGEAMDLLRQKDGLIPQPDWRLGFGPAKYYQLKHLGARVGFIGAITNPHFCETCVWWSSGNPEERWPGTMTLEWAKTPKVCQAQASNEHVGDFAPDYVRR